MQFGNFHLLCFSFRVQCVARVYLAIFVSLVDTILPWMHILFCRWKIFASQEPTLYVTCMLRRCWRISARSNYSVCGRLQHVNTWFIIDYKSMFIYVFHNLGFWYYTLFKNATTYFCGVLYSWHKSGVS